VLTLPLTGRVLSRPASVPLPPWRLAATTPRAPHAGAARQRGDGLEFFALRDYRPGDPPKHIDWRSYAKRRQLVVRQYATDALSPPLFVFDCSAAPRHADFEALVTVACSLLLACAQSGSGVALVLVRDGADSVETSTIDEALDNLATVTPATGDGAAAWATLIERQTRARAICVLSARWDAARAQIASALADARPATWVLTTDPAARGDASAILVTAPARELPLLAMELGATLRQTRRA
jgi:uncharacterized protein (DUF58 family)